jgi:hypothetical protein
MKKNTLILALLMTFLTGFSQSPRLVLLEEFTSSTCGPCAGVNPQFHTWQTQNPDKFTSIYYHVSWPSPGNDPMYLANTVDNSGRVSYYGVGYVPYSVLDGNYYTGNANGWSMTTVNTRQAVDSPFEIHVKHLVSQTQDSVTSTMVVKATQPVSGTLVVHNVIIEKHIHFNTPPGTNGEKDFYNVMKKMMPSKEGTAMPNNMTTGDYMILEGTWPFGTVYDVNEIAAVGFVQNKNTKEVHQAANSSTDPLVFPYDNDVQVMEISSLPTTTCTGKITPSVKIRNNGNNPVTAFDVKYQVNGGEIMSYTWNGNLGSLEKAIVSLPEYEFIPNGNNNVKVFSSQPNNIADEYPKNDTLTAILKTGPVSVSTVILTLRTDNSPQDITWDVKNSLGQVIQTGGPYPQPLVTLRDTIELPVADCYIFTLYDAGGNGICCSNGNGGYELKDIQGTPVRTLGGSFGYSESTEWRLNPPVGTTEIRGGNMLSIYPNPFTSKTTVSYTLTKAENVTIGLFNNLGEKVKSCDPGTQGSGTHETVIDGEGLQAGIYILQVKLGSTVITRKVSVSK